MKTKPFHLALPHLIAVAVFLIITLIYFAPAAFEGKDLVQGDITNAKATGVDIREHFKATGEHVFWSNTMFGGMPANYTAMPPTTNVFRVFGEIFTLGLPKSHLGQFFLALLGFYIFLLALNCKPWLSMIGAIAYAFASYNLIIIGAGHMNKGLVMATMAPILGGIILCYRKKFLWGGLITLIFTGLNILWGHQQITYYLILTIVILALVYLYYAFKEKQLKHFVLSSAVLLVLAGLAVLPALGFLIPSADYAKESMRGGAVLQTDTEGKKESSGLEIDYAFAWSYGKAETMTLLIPNFYGGSSHYALGTDSECYKKLRSTGQARQFCRAAPTYWGAQPFTSGPVYAGAIICFLFVLGLFIVKGPEKWWLLLATVLAILMSWGHNFMAFNEFLFNHLPLYNKFRVPSMSLVIANLAMAALGILAVKELLDHRKDAQFAQTYFKPLYLSFAIVGGLSLIIALFGSSMFDFSGNSDANFPAWLVEALKADRQQLLRSDAWRSFLYILLAFALIWFFIKKPFKEIYVVLGLGLLITLDLWTVDKRFLNHSDFVPKQKAKEILPSEADLQILQDKDPDYRVLNLTTSTFNDARTSYFHKSIGGYSGAKLRRYQDIIDYHFSKGINTNVLNMLNTRYIILPSQEQQGKTVVQRNSQALGNAWFVEKITWVDGPNAEIVALNDFNPAKEVFIDKAWQHLLPNSSTLEQTTDSSAYIRLSDYRSPGNLFYESNNPRAQLAVFSEVHYKTWQVFIDGKRAPLLRVNYILRGLEIPAGRHVIEFKCVDEVYERSAALSKWSSVIVGLLILGFTGFAVFKAVKKSTKRKSE